jgi:hypothetical protein
MKRALATLFAAVSIGCAHADDVQPTSPQISLADVRSVELCRTTEAELRAKFGEPSRDGVIHGQRILTWLIQTEPLPRYLGVMLDSRSLVVDLYWDVPTEVPWVPASQCDNK